MLSSEKSCFDTISLWYCNCIKEPEFKFDFQQGKICNTIYLDFDLRLKHYETWN